MDKEKFDEAEFNIFQWQDRERHTAFPVLFLLQQSNVFVCGRSAQIAHPRKFADIQLPCPVCGVMTEEQSGNILQCGLRSADFRTFRLGVRHTTTNTRADDTQLQFRKHAWHLNERICHRVKFAVGAIHRDTAYNHMLEWL